jgi:hypothetical protein
MARRCEEARRVSDLEIAFGVLAIRATESAQAAMGASAALRGFSDAWFRVPLEIRREIQRRGGIPESERDTK